MKRVKKRVALLLLCAMLLSLVAPISMVSEAASKPKLSKSKATFFVGKTKTIKVKCSIPGKISVKSLNPYFCGVKKVKKTLKKDNPASFTLKGKAAGYSIIAIHVKLKRKVKGNKEFDLRFHAYTEDKPSPSPTPSATPTNTPSPTPTASPSASASAGPTVTPTPTASASASPFVTPSATPSSSPSATPTLAPTPTPVPTPTPDPYNYTVTYTHNLGSDKVVTGMPDPLVVKIPKDGDHKLTLPPAPSCLGYYFDSWIYLNDYRYNPGRVVTVDKDMTIKAYFRRDTSGYIIQYDTGAQLHPEIRGVINGVIVPYGGTLTISSIVPSWEGHRFCGWSIAGYSTLYQPGQEISGISSNLTLYAVWDG